MSGMQCIHTAAIDGDAKMLQAELARGVRVDVCNQSAQTALMLASASGHLDCVELLLERKAVVDQRDSDGWTALLYASLKGHHRVAAALLGSHAQVEARSAVGWNPLLLAVCDGHEDVARVLLENKADARAEIRKSSVRGDADSPLTLAQEPGLVNLLLFAVHCAPAPAAPPAPLPTSDLDG